MQISIVSPFPGWAWPQVWLWIEPIRKRVFTDGAPADQHEFVAQALALNGESYAVYRDGELGGLALAHRLDGRIVRLQSFFKRSFWGRETTAPAVSQVLDRVFASDCEKVTTFPFEDNHAMKSFLQSLGFKLEGTLRKQVTRGGVPIDLLAYGLLREEWRVQAPTAESACNPPLPEVPPQ